MHRTRRRLPRIHRSGEVTASLGRMENETIDDAELTEPAIEEELLVEEISIDGMCGVY